MEIYLVRHAKSAHDYTKWKTDAVRPLAEKGRKRQKAASDGMVKLGMKYQTIWVSPYKRAKQTLDIIQTAFDREDEPKVVDELKVWGVPKKVKELLDNHYKEFPADRLLLVGHNPNMSDLVYLLTGEDVYMKTSDLVHITLDESGYTLVEYYPRDTLIEL